MPATVPALAAARSTARSPCQWNRRWSAVGDRNSGIAISRPNRVVRMSTLSTPASRSEEHTSELQSLMRISYAVFCLKKKKSHTQQNIELHVIKRKHKRLHLITTTY